MDVFAKRGNYATPGKKIALPPYYPILPEKFPEYPTSRVITLRLATLYNTPLQWMQGFSQPPYFSVSPYFFIIIIILFKIFSLLPPT